MSKAAVVVLSYNSLEQTTKPCLESLFACKSETPFVVIVVDNMSTDGTREYLVEQDQKHENLVVVLNDKNYGFAGGNNIGIKACRADHYILLNSDTVVTDHWIDKLISFLESHPEAGMAGPVSNSVGNEQLIHLESTTEDEVIKEGIAYTETCAGDYFYTRMLGFFCVAIPKAVIDRVGLLEECFGLGMFEDDDFCIRVANAGYRLACVEDAFVYHKGSVSFRNTDINVIELFHKNLTLFEQKHNCQWSTGLSAPPFLKVINHYLETETDREKLLYKLRNKVAVMNKLHYPRFDQEMLFAEQRTKIAQLQERLTAVENSITWRLASKVHRLIDKMPFRDRLYSLLHKTA